MEAAAARGAGAGRRASATGASDRATWSRLADGQKLRQVFTNVMRNALEAIEPRRGGGRVEVNLFVEGDRAVVEVIDNGVGIAPEDRDKIFLPFFTTKPSGTGLGMAIVKKIVDLHGGDIASRARRAGARASHLAAGGGRAGATPGGRHAMKRRLLLVEDDEVFLRPLHRTLELEGYEVLPVQSGEEALDTLKSEDVDLVLTDQPPAGHGRRRARAPDQGRAPGPRRWWS